jgi:hypothetical protein
MNSKMIDEMIQKDRLEWESLTAILDAHPEESLHGSNSPPWTSRDIYAHLARWMSYSNQNMEAYCDRKTSSPLVKNFEELNARWQQEDSWMTLMEARNAAHEAFNRRLKILRTIPPDRWDREIDRIAHYDGAEHFAAHRRYIRVA